jgi:predicted small lipoprotein YifL
MGLSTLRNLARITIVLCIASVAITGCGRKGRLDKPSTPVEQQNIRKTGQQPGSATDKPFILDPLL